MIKGTLLGVSALVFGLGATPALADPPTTQAFVTDGNGLVQDPLNASNPSAVATVTLAPIAKVATSASPISGGATASAKLTYDVSIDPSAWANLSVTGFGFLSVPINIAFSGSATATSAAGSGNSSQSSSKVYINDTFDGTYAVQQLNSCNSVGGVEFGTCGDFGGNTDFTFNYLVYFNDFRYPKSIQVLIESYAQASGSASASAFADPVFTLPANSGLTLVLSQGVGNGPGPSAVPEPASWAMMLAGFGLAGAALRRRRFVAARA
jgi:hypothetical protein